MTEPPNVTIARPAIQTAALAAAFNGACVLLGSDGRATLAKFLRDHVADTGHTKAPVPLLVGDFAAAVDEAILEIADAVERMLTA